MQVDNDEYFFRILPLDSYILTKFQIVTLLTIDSTKMKPDCIGNGQNSILKGNDLIEGINK